MDKLTNVRDEQPRLTMSMVLRVWCHSLRTQIHKVTAFKKPLKIYLDLDLVVRWSIQYMLSREELGVLRLAWHNLKSV